MWCDDFDMDLPAVFAGIEQWFRQPLAMWALCRPTGGKINGPAAWWGLGRRGRLGTLVFVQPFAPTSTAGCRCVATRPTIPGCCVRRGT